MNDDAQLGKNLSSFCNKKSCTAPISRDDCHEMKKICYHFENSTPSVCSANRATQRVEFKLQYNIDRFTSLHFGLERPGELLRIGHSETQIFKDDRNDKYQQNKGNFCWRSSSRDCVTTYQVWDASYRCDDFVVCRYRITSSGCTCCGCRQYCDRNATFRHYEYRRKLYGTGRL